MAQEWKKDRRENPEQMALLSDIWGIALAAFGLLLFLSLISFSASDGGIHANMPQEIHNFVGIGGAFIADFVYNIFGLQALLLPMMALGLGLLLLFRKTFSLALHQKIGAFVVFLAIAFLMSNFAFLQRFLSFSAGGLVGDLLEKALLSVTSVLAARITALAFLLIGVVLLSERGLKEHSVQIKAILADKVRLIKTRLALHAGHKAVQEPRLVSIAQEPSSQAAEPVQSPQEEPEKPFVIFAGQAPHNTATSIAPLMQEKEAKDLQIVERDMSTAQRAVEEAEREAQRRVKNYELPPLQLLDYDAPAPVKLDEAHMRSQAMKLEQTFGQFGIEGLVREIRPGPVVTLYEFVPAPGVKLSRITALADDIAMAMEAIHVRVVAPIPGKGAVGIEVPNEERETVFLKEVVADNRYRKVEHKLCMAVGKDIEGKAFFLNLADMPHLLIAGTTGSGKSVSMNAMICSILYRATPADVRFLMIDPKMLELSIYEGIPHLLLPPIIDSKKAALALRWAVREMEQRYLMMSEVGVRDINAYNARIKEAKAGKLELPKRSEEVQHGPMPYIVIVVDEYADLVAVGGKDVEALVMRLAQKARASGIHVMLATQRPSVDVITGVIKANFPVRIGFRLASSPDSRTIVNKPGAEKLLGKGDALIMPPGTSDLVRVHGAFISDKELRRVVDFWKAQSTPDYHMSIVTSAQEEDANAFGEGGGQDERFDEAVDIVIRSNRCSASWLQRHMNVGYNRAARMVEDMEARGIVGAPLNARGDREIFGRQSDDG